MSQHEHSAEPSTEHRLHREAMLKILAHHESYAHFIRFFLDKSRSNPGQARYAIMGQARKNALAMFKYWEKQKIIETNNLPILFQRRDALLAAQEYYDDLLSGDTSVNFVQLSIQLGPNPPITMQNLVRITDAAEMPFLRDWVSKGLLGPFSLSDVTCSDQSFYRTYRERLSARVAGSRSVVRDEDLLACLSYVHTMPETEGETVAPTDKLSSSDAARLKELIRAHLTRYFSDRMFLWVDQACKGSRAESQFDWLSEGLMPYAVLPVLKASGCRGLKDNLQRLWLQVELTLGLSGCGVWWANEEGEVFVQSNAIGYVINPDSAISAVCRTVLTGYTQDLKSFWKEDYMRLQIWATRILSHDRGPRRIEEYKRSAMIQYSGEHIELSARQTWKLALKIATQDQFMPYAMESCVTLEKEERNVWSDTVPFIETGRGRRDDRVYFCREADGRMMPLHRYLKFRTEQGNQFLAVPLTETPTGEVVVGWVDGDNVKTSKANFPGLTDDITDICLALECARLDGQSEESVRAFVKKKVREMDGKILVCLIESGIFSRLDVQTIEYVSWDDVY